MHIDCKSMLLLIQNGHMPVSMPTYLKEKYRIIRSYEVNVANIDIDEYSAIVVLGGNQSVTKIDLYPDLLNVLQLIKKCLVMKKKLLGICLGCQLIAYALGCEIKSSGKLNIGYDVEILGQTKVFRCHMDYVVANDQLDVLKTVDNMPYLYKHGDHAYGIQCHPDITPENVLIYSNCNVCNEYALSHKTEINTSNQIMIDMLLKALDGEPVI